MSGSNLITFARKIQSQKPSTNPIGLHKPFKYPSTSLIIKFVKSETYIMMPMPNKTMQIFYPYFSIPETHSFNFRDLSIFNMRSPCIYNIRGSEFQLPCLIDFQFLSPLHPYDHTPTNPLQTSNPANNP